MRILHFYSLFLLYFRHLGNFELNGISQTYETIASNANYNSSRRNKKQNSDVTSDECAADRFLNKILDHIFVTRQSSKGRVSTLNSLWSAFKNCKGKILSGGRSSPASLSLRHRGYLHPFQSHLHWSRININFSKYHIYVTRRIVF